MESVLCYDISIYLKVQKNDNKEIKYIGVIHLSEKVYSGLIHISDDVISTIAGLATLETNGIASMSGGVSESLAKRLIGKNAQKGVSVKVGQTEVIIDLRVIVNYGTKIQDVCKDLRNNVRDTVEHMTGLLITEVNVVVEGVAFKEVEETHRNG